MLSADLPSAGTGSYVVKRFDTPAGVPNVAGNILSGWTVSFTVWMRKTTTAGTMQPLARVKVNDTNGLQLCEALGATNLTTTLTAYTLSCTTTAIIPMLASDRLFVYVGVNVSAAVGGTATRAELGVEGTLSGTHDSRVTVPLPVPPPVITLLSPASGAVGQLVMVSASNFAVAPITIAFNGTPATPGAGNEFAFATTVPAGATTGPVVITVGGVASNGYGFVVPGHWKTDGIDCWWDASAGADECDPNNGPGRWKTDGTTCWWDDDDWGGPQCTPTWESSIEVIADPDPVPPSFASSVNLLCRVGLINPAGYNGWIMYDAWMTNPAGQTVATLTEESYAALAGEISYDASTSGTYTCYADYFAEPGYLGQATSSFRVALCGDTRDAIIEEYAVRPVIGFVPGCADFAQSGSSFHFSWPQLNQSPGSGHPPWGIVRPALWDLIEGTAAVYDYWGNGPITITSGYRCPHGNALVGGEEDSRHMFGDAFDSKSVTQLWDFNEWEELRDAGLAAGATFYESYFLDPTHLHLDLR